MDTDLCKLSIVYPKNSEDALTAYLNGFEPSLPGYTTWSAQGHGLGFDTATHSERVRGQVARGVLVIILSKTQKETLLADIQQNLPIPHLVFWTEPVLSAGRLI